MDPCTAFAWLGSGVQDFPMIIAPCRLGHDTRHFNVGQYRRKQRNEDEIQDASMFDHKNPVSCSPPFTLI